MAIELFKHNAEAYEKALHLLQSTGKAAVIHPTGTGKSFIGFKLCEDFPKAKIFWLSPSEYIFRTQLQNLEEASDGYEPDNVEFCTYARLMRMDEGEMGEIYPDYIVLDEFHRCGAELWGQGVQTLLSLYPHVPVLGLSATAIRYLDNRRNMADELFAGNVASEMTLGDAIVRGILNPPRYVTTVYSYQNELARYRRRVRQVPNPAQRDEAELYLEKLRRALENADGLDRIFEKHISDRCGKYVVFCSDNKHMQEMKAKAGEWFGRIDPSPRIYSVYSLDPTTSSDFEAFKADDSESHLRLLYCIDALNEGIHVEGLSGVILLRPTVSPIIYKQQIGRALSASGKRDAVIFDIVMNIDNLYSIDAVREEMQQALSYYRSFGDSGSVVNDRFDVIDELRNCRGLFQKLDRALNASWDVMYGLAKAYFEAHGDLNVPYNYRTEEGYSLGRWVNAQRRQYRGENANGPDASRVKQLDAIGMIWDTKTERSWNKYYAAAESYYRAHGDLMVPCEWVTDDGVALGTWIAYLRRCRKLNGSSVYLQKEKINALNQIGMVWDVKTSWADSRMEAVERYYRAHGNLDVPVQYTDAEGVNLGMWISKLRRSSRKDVQSYLSDAQIARLDAYGMRWGNRNEQIWEHGYEAAKRYAAAHGNLDVSSRYVDSEGNRVGTWIHQRKTDYRKGKLSAERIALLDALDPQWRVDPWDRYFELAKRYFDANGHLEISASYTVDGVKLGRWLARQRKLLSASGENARLSEKQIRLLESVGITRSAKESQWDARYNAFLSYYKENGTVAAPPAMMLSDGKKAGSWIRDQRKARAEGRLTDEQIDKLNQIGMKWEKEDAWDCGYRHAQDYFRAHDNLSLPFSYRSPDGYKLGVWLDCQRRRYRQDPRLKPLTREQISLLEQIGMVWHPGEHQWEMMYRRAAEYREQYGNLNVTARDRELYYWLKSQRSKRREGRLSEAQIQKLNQIGMIWEDGQKAFRNQAVNLQPSARV